VSLRFRNAVVAANPNTVAFAKKNGYSAFAPQDTFDAQASPSGGSVPIKTFWSATLEDTLTTASKEGL
jgi:hypothetical protein